jgi:ankyrin repeat protein
VLLRHGAAVEAADQWRANHAMHLAAWSGQREVVQLLLTEGGARADAVNAEGWTPLHFAAATGDPKLVRMSAACFLLECVGETALRRCQVCFVWRSEQSALKRCVSGQLR